MSLKKYIRELKDNDYYKYARILEKRHIFRPFYDACGSKKMLMEFVNNIDLTYLKYYEDNQAHNCPNVETYLKMVRPSILLVNAFNWGRSMQGDAVWRNINFKYRKFLGYNPNNWNASCDYEYKLGD